MENALSPSFSSDYAGFAGIKKLSSIFFPTLLMILMETINQFMEKVFLGYVSVEALTISVNVHYFMRMFLIPALVLTPLTQVHVGQLLGRKEDQEVGKGVWQVIWFSLLLSFLVFMIGYPFGKYYFWQMPYAKQTLPFFLSYISIYLFFPLKAAFIGFYFGIGKVKGISLVMSLAYLVHMGLNYALIPHFGLMGAVCNCLITHVLLCTVLFSYFLFSKKTKKFLPRFSPFQPTLFFPLIKPGLNRVASQFIVAAAWVLVSFVMNQLGPLHSSILAVGTTISFFFYCFGQAMIISTSNLHAPLVGISALDSIKKLLSTSFYFTLLLSIPIGFFLLIFPEKTFAYLFPKISLDPSQVRLVFGVLWLTFVSSCFAMSRVGALFAFKKTFVFLLSSFWSIIADFGCATVLGMKMLHVSPYHFWGLIFLTNAFVCLFYQKAVHSFCQKILRKELA